MDQCNADVEPSAWSLVRQRCGIASETQVERLVQIWDHGQDALAAQKVRSALEVAHIGSFIKSIRWVHESY